MKRLSHILFTILLLAVAMGACKRVKLSDADQKFAEGEYFTAADMYRKIYRKVPAKDRQQRGMVAHRLAESNRLANNPLRASSAYANAVRYKVEDSTLHLQYARTLHKIGKYKEAGEQYQKFLELFPNNKFAQNGLEGTKIAPVWRKNPTEYKVKKMDLFLSRAGEYAPMLLPPDYDQVFFASNGKEATGDTISGITGAKLSDIYMSRKDENGKWMKPEHLTSDINTAGDEAGVSFLADGSAMYYTSCPPDSTGAAIVSIYMAHRSGGTWNKGAKIEIKSQDTKSVFAHPSISPSGNYLYFVSDMPGGFGGKDIWRARMVGDLVEFVENLGPDINTAGDEMFPTLRNDTTLYFSSDGHVGMGGLDIYKADYNRERKGWDIENMRYPVNSSGDDFGITFAGSEETGFFSSNRNDGRGYDHIYSFVEPHTKTIVEGYIVDTDDEFVAKATVRMVGRDGTNNRIQGKNNGTYSSDINRGVDYVFLASSEGYLNSRKSLKTASVDKDSTYLVDFILTPIFKPVVLENVFYDFDKATLTPDSRKELDGLIDLLNQNPNVTIELSSHTDRKGTDEYNDRLSQRRAQSAVDYLIEKGIDKNRLEAAGKGKQAPKVVTKAVIKRFPFLKEGEVLTEEFVLELPSEQQEMADQINRRTEFKVMSITYNLD